MLKALGKIIGSANDRALKRYKAVVAKVSSLEDEISLLTDEGLRDKLQEAKATLAKGAKLIDVLPLSFALTREAAKRSLNQRHYDVQLLGGMILNDGKIAEMKTGEGKTLVATLPVVLNALTGKGVHIVTVNDYLAKRDSEWMGSVYNQLGISVGCITPNMDDIERKKAYAADVTYGTNSELGFDYLRDNLRVSLDDMVQREFNYAIVDEVDSILIDEARTPLVISGSYEGGAELYIKVDPLVKKLSEGDYELDEKNRSVILSDQGSVNIEDIIKSAGLLSGGNLYDTDNIGILHHIQQALRAHKLYQKDVHYIVKDGEVVLVDEFTGRTMQGRRLSDGLHQAIEAKEKLNIKAENQTLASVTYQNFFRLYSKLAGMTGTAMTEAAEFHDIYNLEVIEVPTHQQMVRKDNNDEVFRTSKARDSALITEVKKAHETGQPVLIGTQSIEKSESLSKSLQKEKIKHRVLNARQHAKEAEIIANAGSLGAVTIATNMAGRGTDIQLGSDEEEKKKVIACGGLYVLGTGRHESRRIDNQLRGRSGRQGDPGQSRFFLSLDDELLRIFGAERLEKLLGRMGLKEDESMVHSLLSRTIEQAQQKVERMNYEIRKQLLRFDDVMNDQRKIIFAERKELMGMDDISSSIDEMKKDVVENIVHSSIPPQAMPSEWDIEKLTSDVHQHFDLDSPVADWAEEEGVTEVEIAQKLEEEITEKMFERAKSYNLVEVKNAYKQLTLMMLDRQWKDHLQSLERLRRGIGLRAYGQRDPLNEYKKEAFVLFSEMLARFKLNLISLLSRIRFNSEKRVAAKPAAPQNYSTNKDSKPFVEGNKKIARNAPCPCGSNRKYKHCHGKVG